MSRSAGAVSLVFLALLAALPSPAVLADGFIYVPDVRWIPVPVRPPRPWPVRPNFPRQGTRHRVEVEIDENVARTRVDESFYNPNDAQLEGVYMFPLPPEAAVSGFAMKMGGREVSGEILEKGKARELYEQIVRQVRDPGLLEYVDRGLFRASVFPIPPRGTVEVSLQYSETLPRERGTATYRYPLDTGKYSAGPYRDVLVDVRLRSAAPIRSIQCPSHEATAISRAGEREARLTFEARELRADKDFVVTWNVSEDALAPVVIAHRGSQQEGFFYFAIQPRPDKPKGPVAKDIVFVIDTSGSMLGPKMEQVKKALRYCVTGLNQGDRFNVVSFSTEARRFRDGLVDGTEENRKLAGAFIDEMKASGGTNLEEGLRLGISDLRSPERLQLVVLLSDGEPTIGVTATNDILRMVKEKNPQRRRAFVFGVGEDLNAKLLDAIAKDTGGATQYIRSQENIEVPLSTFFDKIDSPVLTDLRVEFPAGGVSDLFPRPLPDLFRGEQLEVFGRYQGDGMRTVVVRGKLQGEERVFEYSLPFVAAPNGHVARLWAQRKIGYLLEQMRLSGESKEVKDEVVRLSKLYGVITPYTSYLILEEDRLTRRDLPPPPEGTFYLAASEALRAVPPGAAAPAEPEVRLRAEDAARDFRAEKGAGAVESSRELSELSLGGGEGRGGAGTRRFLEQVVNRDSVRMKQVDDRSFYLQGDRWIDAALTDKRLADGTQVKKVKYLSDEYFAVLRSEPGIGKILSVGERVTFLWKGAVIAVEA
ncbi:MAG: VWA domain-containing protein [Planctomycetes bacterium]|nr:VWA domain-containing protein [Planctomycetota bacterium]